MRKRMPTHPGEVLREDVLPALGITKKDFADALGVSRNTLYSVLNEEARVTPTLALRIGKVCGNGPGLWLNMQQAFDLWHAERELDLSKIVKIEAA